MDRKGVEAVTGKKYSFLLFGLVALGAGHGLNQRYTRALNVLRRQHD